MTLVYVGTYTRNTALEGVYVYDLDLDSGMLQHLPTATGVENPRYLALCPDGSRPR